MSDDPKNADDVRQLRRIMPIPTHWVPIFMDGPSADVAIGRLTALVQQAEQEQLDDYAPFIYMLTTASCVLQEDTNVSIMAIEASKLDYRTQVRATAEELWNRPENPSKLGMGNSATYRKKSDTTVTDDDRVSDEETMRKASRIPTKPQLMGPRASGRMREPPHSGPQQNHDGSSRRHSSARPCWK
jgi:hypothetical protein